jgi:peptidoglycan hydrolase CwlO-like protein
MKVPLETVISKMTGLNFANADLETEDKSETIRKLRKQVAELERELDEREQKIDEYQLQLDDRDRDISNLRRMVNID